MNQNRSIIYLSSKPAFRNLILAVVIAVFFLIVAGISLRVSESGSTCPDWPTCFGQWTPPSDRGALIAYTHRFSSLLAGGLLFLTVFYAILQSRQANLITVSLSISSIAIAHSDRSWSGCHRSRCIPILNLPPPRFGVNDPGDFTVCSNVHLLCEIIDPLAGFEPAQPARPEDKTLLSIFFCSLIRSHSTGNLPIISQWCLVVRQQRRQFFLLLAFVQWISLASVFEERSGGRSARERFVTSEEVVARAPDVMLASWCGKPFDRASVLARPGWDRVPAVRRGAVHEVDSCLILQPGPAALTDGLDALERLLQE